MPTNRMAVFISCTQSSFPSIQTPFTPCAHASCQTSMHSCTHASLSLPAPMHCFRYTRMQGLEEASRLYFGESNVEGMLAVLLPLHEMMEQTGPTTLREIAFVQTYGRCGHPVASTLPIIIFCLREPAVACVLQWYWWRCRLEFRGLMTFWGSSDPGLGFQ